MKKREKMLKGKKGITLIALVVTIVVLLILAGISLNLVLGQNGIISRTKEARDKTKQAQIDGETGMNQLIDEMNGYIDSEDTPKVATIYAKLYTDGTLIFSSTDYTDSSRTISEDYGDISKINATKWQDLGWLGNNKNKASNIIIYDKIYPTSTSYWFYCFEGETLDLSNVNTSDTVNMTKMFESCRKLTSLDVSNFDTSNVTNMSNMFFYCSELTNIDLNSFNTSKVTNMQGMFEVCGNLKKLDLNGFDKQCFRHELYV